MTLSLACLDLDGDHTSPPILFVHGFGHHRAVWRGTTRALAGRWRSISIDLRGHGESPWSPDCAYDLDDYANDLPGVLDERAIESTHVVAHSLGGQVALLFAAVHPDRVRSLTLVDTGPALRSDGTRHVGAEIDDAFRSYPSIGAYRRVLAQMHPFADDALLDEIAQMSLRRRLDGRFDVALDPGVLGPRRASKREYESRSTRLAREERLWQSYRRLEVPVLVARGRLSSILDEKVARAMTSAPFTSRRLAQFEGAGHAIMIDACRDFSTELREFLESVERNGRPDPGS